MYKTVDNVYISPLVNLFNWFSSKNISFFLWICFSATILPIWLLAVLLVLLYIKWMEGTRIRYCPVTNWYVRFSWKFYFFEENENPHLEQLLTANSIYQDLSTSFVKFSSHTNNNFVKCSLFCLCELFKWIILVSITSFLRLSFTFEAFFNPSCARTV